LPLKGTRVFAVDDEALVLFSLQDMLEDLGCSVVASALRLEDALSKAKVLDFDIAVLDVNLSGKRVDPVADILVTRNVPFIFATGYDRSSLPAYHNERVAIAKPYLIGQLQLALQDGLRSAAVTNPIRT
jgi:CheY-like chemotaxis protein